ncbi:MAG: HAMP domain-containing histidine kinase [Candidatus Accumulibacter sp.]|jgi:signal transduction histidine kinase|nr:HAMP domain-containing histidine kinase [Accumulibacter sp.]
MSRKSRQTLAYRIVAAFVLMTFVVSGAFSLGLKYVMEEVEAELISKTLGGRLGAFVVDHVPKGEMPGTERGLRFFVQGDPRLKTDDIPPEFQDARPGFNEIGDYWVVVREQGGRRYMLAQDQREYEDYEQAVFAALLAGFVLTVAGAWGLGSLMARRILSPVNRLAEQVRHLDAASSLSAPLAQDYADDEVGQVAEAFDHTMARLAKALERERLFTSDVSHELRTPLMVVTTSCELLDTADLPANAREKIARIARVAHEMQNLVATFLTLARPEDGASGQRTAEAGVTLAAAAEEERLRWLPGIHAKGLAFEMVEEEVDTGRYHAAFLSTVIGNLLRNALYYTNQGHIRLVLEEGGFRVEDSGAGVPEAEKTRVFQPFTRGEQKRGEGMGLGLSLVQRICAHQGWRIELRARPGGGSVFRVSFRLQKQP